MREISPQRSSRSNGTMKLSRSVILVLVFMLFNTIVPVVSAVTKLVSVEKLVIGDYLESLDKTKRFVIQDDGNAVVYQNITTPLWASGKIAPNSIFYISLSDVGEICVFDKDNKCVKSLARIADPVRDQWELTHLNTGILILKDPKGVIRWNNIQNSELTALKSEVPFFDHALPSPNYQYFLSMQGDGNLVFYNAYKAERAFSPFYRRRSVYLCLSRTGILSLNAITGGSYIISKKATGKVDTYSLAVTNDGKILDDSNGNLFELI
ncbi:MAG: hypothetical protein J3Q66DRAFT_321005 [Benniella sp.]|nr:MAG: hypothetical protein J3Q66DRAFT_321005 [Benniella sp.]